jgi:hypothetical protein
MSPADDTLSTGSEPLDATLGGGLPRGTVTALAGPTGTGKRPLALQFLAAGGSADDSGTYVTAVESADAVSRALTALSLDGSDVAVRSLRDERGRLPEAADGTPDLAAGVRDALTGSPERVVLDVGTLGPGGGPAAARHALDDLDATALVVADGWSPAVGSGTHGLLRTRRADATPDRRALLHVERLHGAAADRRPVEVQVTGDGVAVGPERRTSRAALADDEPWSVGVPGLDAMCGGGLVTGEGVLLRHDGRADLGALLGTLVAKAVTDGYAVELVPTIGLRASRLAALLEGFDASLSALLDADRLFVLDVIGAWEAGRQNVFRGGDEPEELKANLRGIADRTDRPHLRIVNADAMVHGFGNAGARDLRYFQEASLLSPDDVLVHVQNPDVVDDRMAALYEQSASQVLATAQTDDGRQHVALRKSPRGHVGTTALVDFGDRPPFLDVETPPGA